MSMSIYVCEFTTAVPFAVLVPIAKMSVCEGRGGEEGDGLYHRRTRTFATLSPKYTTWDKREVCTELHTW